MRQMRQRLKRRFHECMAGLARNLGNKTSAASIVFPTGIIKWISRIKLPVYIHVLPSQKYKPLTREGASIGTAMFRRPDNARRSHYLRASPIHGLAYVDTRQNLRQH